MTFINEIPSAETIAKYDLKHFVHGLNSPPEYRRMWTVDYDRNLYLFGGLTHRGGRDFDEDPWGWFRFYLNGPLYEVTLQYDGTGSRHKKENPFIVKWGKPTGIKLLRPGLPNAKFDRFDPLPYNAWLQAPDEPQPLLSGITLNQFFQILREALSVRGAGDCNRHIHNPIIVELGF